MTLTDRMSYTEVCEILKYVPQEELNKIPESTITFFESNKDETYDFTYDVSKSLGEQKVLRKTNSIILDLYIRYFATDMQKTKIEEILHNNELIYQEELREQYNPDNLFKKSEVINETPSKEETSMIEYKENIFMKLIKRLMKIGKKE